MSDTAKPLRFFLGANTPQGFVSRFDQLADPTDGWREFVIKGGPGAGKSTLMKRVADFAADRCGQVELIHCSSDADSLESCLISKPRLRMVRRPMPARCNIRNCTD